jgi:Tol biopolymer transport system component
MFRKAANSGPPTWTPEPACAYPICTQRLSSRALSITGLKISLRPFGRPSVILLLALTAAACGGGESNNEPDEGDPAVSRDGKWIAFTSNGAVHVARLGKAARRITDPGKDIDAFPDWSPDGSRIVFARAGKAQFDPWMLYVVNADGSGLRRLTKGDGPLGERAPSWSPDGEKIAFERFGLPRSAHTIDMDGTNERLLLRGAGEPAWSPDGSKIAFVQQGAVIQGVAGGFRPLGQAIAVFDLETKSIKRVIDAAKLGVAQVGNAEDPAWSPDGTRIAFASTPGDFPEIYVANVDGTGLRRLTRHTEVDESPTWTADGRIVFASFRSGPSRLYVMNRDGSGVRRFFP